MTLAVHRAERRKAKLRLAIAGPSGSGKTFGAIMVAKGLVGPKGRILMVDTERGSGELYADMAAYDVAPMDPPYLTEHYIEAIRYAEDNGYDCLILDSISHAWAGQGGLLDQNREISEHTGNGFSGWSRLVQKQNRFVDAMLNAKIHVIATMRCRTDYAQVQDANGKTRPEKRARAPVQRDGIDYEFTIVFDVAPNHTAEATKDRSGMFDDAIFRLSEETGEKLRGWLETGTPVPEPVPETVPREKKAEPKNIYTRNEIDKIRATYEEKGWSTAAIDDARIDAATWDKDAIQADFTKRNAASVPANPAPAPAPRTDSADKPKHPCSAWEAKFYIDTMVNRGMQTAGLLAKAKVADNVYDRDIIQASFDAQKKQNPGPSPPAKPEEAPVPTDVRLSGETCETCGARLLESESRGSRNFCDGHVFCEHHQMEYIRNRHAATA